MTDEPMESMRQNAELLQGMMHDLMVRVDRLAEVSERHERQWQQFRRAMRAGLTAWLDESSEPGGES